MKKRGVIKYKFHGEKYDEKMKTQKKSAKYVLT